MVEDLNICVPLYNENPIRAGVSLLVDIQNLCPFRDDNHIVACYNSTIIH